MNENPATWNKETVCDGELRELVKRIHAICEREQLPYLFTVAYRNTPIGDDCATGYISSFTPGPNDIADPRLSEALAVIRGQHALSLLASVLSAAKPTFESSRN